MKGIAGLYHAAGDLPAALVEALAAATGDVTLYRPAPGVLFAAGEGADGASAGELTTVCVGEVVAPPGASAVPSLANAVVTVQRAGHSPAEELNGGFAYALWDGERQVFELAVDRFRFVPLVYARLGPVLAFASEVRPGQ